MKTFEENKNDQRNIHRDKRIKHLVKCDDCDNLISKNKGKVNGGYCDNCIEANY